MCAEGEIIQAVPISYIKLSSVEDQLYKRARAIFKKRKKGSPGLTQTTVAKEMGCSKSMLSELLRGDKAWSPKWVGSFCRAMGIEVGEFLEGMNDNLNKDTEWLLNRLFPDREHKNIHVLVQKIFRYAQLLRGSLGGQKNT